MVAKLQMARASHYEGDDGAALPVVQALVPEMEKVLGPSHPHTLAARELLSQALAGVGLYDDAIEVQQSSLKRLAADDAAQRAIEQSILATHLKRAQRYGEALPLAQESLRFYEAKYERSDYSSLFVRRLLAEILLGAGQTRQGTETAESVREAILTVQGYQSRPDWPAVLGVLAEARRLNGDLPAATSLLDQECTLLSAKPGRPRLASLRCQAERTWLLAMSAPQDAAARDTFAAAAQAYRQRFAENHPARADLAMMQVLLDTASGRGKADDLRRASATWQASMHRPWPGQLIELH